MTQRLRDRLPADHNGEPATPGVYVVETKDGQVHVAQRTKDTLWTFGRALTDVVRHARVEV